MAKNGYLYDCLLPWQQSAIYSYDWKRNPRCVANLHCECQELKPKAETNSSFLVLHPSSGVHTVNTVGSHLKVNYGKKVELQKNQIIDEVVTENYALNKRLVHSVLVGISSFISMLKCSFT